MARYSERHAKQGQLLSLVALIALWAVLHASVAAFRDVSILEAGLVDTDSYMRLVRIGELVETWQWFDGTIARANAPYGDTLHWTRPFDVLILLVALPASLALGSEQALHATGVFISPFLQLATALLLIWALRPIMRPAVSFLPAVAFLLQPGALAYSTLGRADHHALLLLIFVVTTGFLLRALRDPQDIRSALTAGASAGFGVWLSVEFLLAVGLALAALGLPWLAGERERAAQNRWYALAMSLVLLAALFVERPLGTLLEPSYDRVSSVHYLLAVGLLLFWCAVEALETRGRYTGSFAGRAALGTVGAGAIALLLTAVYPLFFAGPMAEVDPRIVPIWLDRVREMSPLLPTDRHTLGRFILYLGSGVLVAPLLLKVLAEERGSPCFSSCFYITIACLLLSLVAVRHLRFSGYAEIAFVMALAVVFDRFLLWTGRVRADLLRGLLRGSFVSVLLLGPFLIGGTLIARDPEAKEAEGCSVREMAAYLESDPRWTTAPQTVLAFMDIGPELLYRTRHHVIGTPYHRNGDGIYDGHHILATADGGKARAMIEQRGVDLVLLCLSSPERGFYAPADGEQNLYSRLEAGNPPDWLEAIALPDSLQDQARLYRVLR